MVSICLIYEFVQLDTKSLMLKLGLVLLIFHLDFLKFDYTILFDYRTYRILKRKRDL